MNNSKTILVIGSYGHAGSKIVKGLIDKTLFNVIATGRKLEKLEQLKNECDSNRITIELLDGTNKNKLKKCCTKTDLIINAVGPYSMGGIDIVKTILTCGKPYIDMANEQLHLKNLREIKPDIDRGGNMVFTCTGQSPGVSTLAMTHMAKLVKNVNSIEMYLVVGRLPTPDQGLASMMSGVIEASLGSKTFVNGEYINERMGKFVKKHTMPEPFGEMNMLSCPLNDSILVPEAVQCKSVRTLFGFELDFPPGLFMTLSWLKPHKRKWVYGLLEKVMRKTLLNNHKMGFKEGFNPGGYIKVVITGNECIEGLIKVEDNSIMTSYMPIIAAINHFDHPEKFKGLLTPNDVYTFDSFNKELDKLGWKININLNHLEYSV